MNKDRMLGVYNVATSRKTSGEISSMIMMMTTTTTTTMTMKMIINMMMMMMMMMMTTTMMMMIRRSYNIGEDKSIYIYKYHFVE